MRAEMGGRIRQGIALFLLCTPWAFYSVMPAQEKSPAPTQGPAADPQKAPPGGKNLNFRQDGLVPMNKQETVLVDRIGKRVLLKTKVVLAQGALEMLCCLKQTKEHEAILALDGLAQDVHAALLVVGAKPGQPVTYEPEFRPPTGEKIDIFLQWSDRQGNPKRVKAQTWVRRTTQRIVPFPLEKLPEGVELNAETDLKYDPKRKEIYWFGIMSEGQRDFWLNESPDPAYQKVINMIFKETQIQEMKADWVFAGSQFYIDEFSGRQRYLAEGGDLICVANFSSATLDITTPSSSTNDQLVYEAYTERIPPRNTEVTMELIPRPAVPAGAKPADPKASPAPQNPAAK